MNKTIFLSAQSASDRLDITLIDESGPQATAASAGGPWAPGVTHCRSQDDDEDDDDDNW